jgi:hypothetical protein
MKTRAPKDLFEKSEKLLYARYSELLKLREMVKKAQFKTTGEIKSDKHRGSFKRRR